MKQVRALKFKLHSLPSKFSSRSYVINLSTSSFILNSYAYTAIHINFVKNYPAPILSITLIDMKESHYWVDSHLIVVDSGIFLHCTYLVIVVACELCHLSVTMKFSPDH